MSNNSDPVLISILGNSFPFQQNQFQSFFFHLSSLNFLKMLKVIFCVCSTRLHFINCRTLVKISRISGASIMIIKEAKQNLDRGEREKRFFPHYSENTQKAPLKERETNLIFHKPSS